MGRQGQAYLYAVGATLLWSTVASSFKVSLRHLEPSHMLFYAALVAVGALLAAAVAGGKLQLLFALSRGQWLRCAGLGLLNPCIYYLVLFEAYDRLPAQEAQPLNYAWPLALALLSVPALRQPLGRAALAGVCVSFLGVVVISTRGDVLSLRVTDPVGAALALGSAFIWAGFWLANVRGQGDETARLLASFAFGAVFAGAAAFVLSGPPTWHPVGVAAAAYAGLFEMGVTFPLWMRALALSRTTAQVSNLVYLAPFLSLGFINVVAGESIMPSSVAGLALIVGGIAISRIERAAPPAPSA